MPPPPSRSDYPTPLHTPPRSAAPENYPAYPCPAISHPCRVAHYCLSSDCRLLLTHLALLLNHCRFHSHSHGFSRHFHSQPLFVSQEPPPPSQAAHAPSPGHPAHVTLPHPGHPYVQAPAFPQSSLSQPCLPLLSTLPRQQEQESDKHESRVADVVSGLAGLD